MHGAKTVLQRCPSLLALQNTNKGGAHPLSTVLRPCLGWISRRRFGTLTVPVDVASVPLSCPISGSPGQDWFVNPDLSDSNNNPLSTTLSHQLLCRLLFLALTFSHPLLPPNLGHLVSASQFTPRSLVAFSLAYILCLSGWVGALDCVGDGVPPHHSSSSSPITQLTHSSITHWKHKHSARRERRTANRSEIRLSNAYPKLHK